MEKKQVYVPVNTTYGRELEAVLHEMMKVEVRPDDVLALKDDFYYMLSLENYQEAKGKLERLTDILGENDADVVQARISYELEQI